MSPRASLRKNLIRLAFENPDLRPEIIPLLKQGYDMSRKPSREQVAEIVDIPWQEWEWQALPDDIWRFFKRGVSGTILVPIKQLTPIRAREKGIANANKFMWLAYYGTMDRRKPLDLRDNQDGTFTVLDGNSTFANAQKSGWKALAGVIKE